MGRESSSNALLSEEDTYWKPQGTRATRFASDSCFARLGMRESHPVERGIQFDLADFRFRGKMGPGVRRGDWQLSFEVEQFPRTAVSSNATPRLA